jgi:RNA polymerase sigma-70 factor (ECF subfamily)
MAQDFFAMALKGRLFQRADRNRGKFRSLVLKALQNFLRDAEDKRRALKRGGHVQFVSWDDSIAEAPSQLSIAAQGLENLSPEKVFDVRWAATLVERALRRLGDACDKRVFDALTSCLAAEQENVSYAKFSKTLGLPEAVVKRTVRRLRQRYRTLLREEVAQTVGGPEEIDDELRYLCAVLSAAE